MRRSVRGGTVAVLAALLAVTGTSSAGATAPGSRHPVSARVWLTTVDGAELLREQAAVPFRTGASDLPTIVVDPLRSYQAMDGFGASITDSSATVLSGLSPAARQDALRRLFDPVAGIGVSFLRQPIGSSDFTAAAQHYTYDDVPAGATDFDLVHFSIAHDEARILPLLRQARRLNPRLTILATPWSAPAWMKTSGSLVGGQLKDDPAIYRAYARYLVKFVQAYAAAGVPVDYLTVQNEPQNRAPAAYPGVDMPVAQQAKVIEALGPLLRAASPHTRILAYDHNWSTHPGDIDSTPPGRSPETDYPYQLLSGPAARWIAGTAFHCYYGDPSAQSALHEAFPDKGIWFTECSGSHGPDDPPAKFFRDTLVWHARTIAIGTTRNWARSVVNWNLALDPTGGPHLGGCGTCTGLLTIGADGTVTTNAEYYTIGHLSKFVQPGAVRVASTSFGTTGWNGQIMDVAFRNPDGSTALVVHNENDDPRSFAVAVGDRIFEYTLPGGALATFTWPADPSLRPRLRQLDLTGASATASPVGESPAAAIDGDAATRWSSGAGQFPGQYLQLDLGRAVGFRRVAVDSGGNLGDFARGWQLSASDDGTTWRTLATGTATGQLSNVDLPYTRARHLRITATAVAGNWWSVSDVRLYR
ncbi:discoidin domain-containing protein [Catellatospora tritici]|uniref:discoidin domain-containing protein n=1 Tax=Catellatospora tritici TaxID=2851566 RepID=UPI001C2D1B40|nr:discoidin domain-containing protein [Catellatospora tritici]MBV1850564.1 discoidin domain-containing protein [Catellatospora tritici]